MDDNTRQITGERKNISTPNLRNINAGPTRGYCLSKPLKFRGDSKEMNSTPTIIDNVSELLNRVLEFTKQRHNILSSNIMDFENNGFLPRDLDITEFSDCMATAIYEHLSSKRLLLCDSDNIRFGKMGSLQTDPVTDNDAIKLLETDIDGYFEYQIRKLSENLLSSKIAAKLLSQRQVQLQP